MRLDLVTRKKIANEITGRYLKASKKERGRILDEFCELTGYNRSYAAWMLRKDQPARRLGARAKKKPSKKTGQGRKQVYGVEVKVALVKVWAILDCPCGKRLAAALPETVKALEKFGELRTTEEVRAKLLRMSPATADRLLSSERHKFTLKSRHKTKPGSLLKHQIPIRTFADWNEECVGFCEMDLVGHDGGSTAGEYCLSLDVTDVRSGWTELQAVRNKAQRWTFEALGRIREDMPFPLLGLDSDNGGEFINDQLFRYCEQNEITFTRSRPYRKNDNCYVEQKNYTAVRRYTGYPRYEGDEDLELLNQLYEVLCPYLNFFQPQARLIEKVREGSRVTKRYDYPKTPYRRLLEDPEVDDLIKRKLKRRYAKLNPAQMMRDINRIQRRLYKRHIDDENQFEEAEQDVINFE